MAASLGQKSDISTKQAALEGFGEVMGSSGKAFSDPLSLPDDTKVG